MDFKTPAIGIGPHCPELKKIIKTFLNGGQKNNFLVVSKLEGHKNGKRNYNFC